MNQVATFEKVSFAQFVKDWAAICNYKLPLSDDDAAIVRRMYDEIELPQRQTDGSAGYDFHIPFHSYFTKDKAAVTIPTGIRVKIEPGWFLMCVPRSGLGFKYGLHLRNTAGIIDSDYYNADNEGHIMAKLVFDQPFELQAGDRFMQGILMPYGIATNGNAGGNRTGGFGSTGV